MLRIVKLHLAAEQRDEFLKAADDLDVVDTWIEKTANDTLIVELLVHVDQTEAVVEMLEGKFRSNDDFRILILPVEASVPQPERKEETDEKPEKETAEAEDDEKKPPPISVEELYDDVTSGMSLDWTFGLMTFLSAIVAAVGIIRNDVAIVIAAMIIAPLLKPNLSLSLATTLGDFDLTKRALKVSVFGLGLALATSVVFGALIGVDPTIEQIDLRTKMGLLELLLAASAGAAGALSFTTGEAGKVVGVMVAVALLPPVVVLGMLLGDGQWTKSIGALYLTSANVVCLNLAGVLTFFAQRIRPRTAFESKRAGKAFRRAIVIWLVLLAILVALIVFGGEFRRFP